MTVRRLLFSAQVFQTKHSKQLPFFQKSFKPHSANKILQDLDKLFVVIFSLSRCHWQWLESNSRPWDDAGNTKGGSIIVPLTSCLSGLYKPVLQIKTKIVSCHTADSEPVKQEVNRTVILPPLVFPWMMA
jgi:hypothetical protein